MGLLANRVMATFFLEYTMYNSRGKNDQCRIMCQIIGYNERRIKEETTSFCKMEVLDLQDNKYKGEHVRGGIGKIRLYGV